MTDIELIELAAKAAGYEIFRRFKDGRLAVDTGTILTSDWNPLTDDGETLRLAVALGLQLFPSARTMDGFTCTAAAIGMVRLSEVIATSDACADMRRAVVLAAAKIAMDDALQSCRDIGS